MRPVNDVIGEVILEIVAEGPHQPALGQVSGDERRSAERHEISRDGGLDHRRRVVDLQTSRCSQSRLFAAMSAMLETYSRKPSTGHGSANDVASQQGREAG